MIDVFDLWIQKNLTIRLYWISFRLTFSMTIEELTEKEYTTILSHFFIFCKPLQNIPQEEEGDRVDRGKWFDFKFERK